MDQGRIGMGAKKRVDGNGTGCENPAKPEQQTSNILHGQMVYRKSDSYYD